MANITSFFKLVLVEIVLLELALETEYALEGHNFLRRSAKSEFPLGNSFPFLFNIMCVSFQTGSKLPLVFCRDRIILVDPRSRVHRGVFSNFVSILTFGMNESSVLSFDSV